MLGFSFGSRQSRRDGGAGTLLRRCNVYSEIQAAFLVEATLDAFVDSRSQQLSAVPDAFHTLDMGFTQGDPPEKHGRFAVTFY